MAKVNIGDRFGKLVVVDRIEVPKYRKSSDSNGKTYKEQAQALENAGYSTAKDEEGNLIYADKLIRVIQENNLMLYDTLVKRK